ncbi:BNR/Asp-box repeat protein [Paraphaeosphaeria minitans]|uniref:BNR/Asp-box repeat protein n=1 Tax=Paraphaeosphaeria minitans TaxID=565426 RepID=A0A9P6G7M4_9PLEO|nr:BNR/Asp-box repeat protein [Paraphaeosphaeria minitans]
MRSRQLILAGLAVLSPVLAQDPTDQPDPPAPTPTGIDVFANVTLYEPDGSVQVTTPRTESLPNNTVLAAWNDPSSKGSIAIYRSTNNGYSWYPLGTATSDSGKRLLQPHLLYINGTYGDDTGITLLAVNAVDDRTTTIELYTSGDQGESWDLASEIASGRPLNNATAAVASPYPVHNGDSITVFYTGAGDKTHAQKIVQQTTTENYDSWDDPVDVVTPQFPSDQPAAPSIAKIANNKYIIAFQYGLRDANASTYTYPIYYKITSNPQKAASDHTREVRVDTSLVLSGVPSVTWAPLGGANGTIVLSDSKSNSVFVNQYLGEGEWWELNTTAGRAFGREVTVPPNDQTKLRFAGGAEWAGSSTSQILITVMDLQKALGA